MVKGNIEAIKAARLERGWSLSELAKQVDVTKETVARIERGLSTYPDRADCEEYHQSLSRTEASYENIRNQARRLL